MAGLTYYPMAWCRLHLKLEEFGQPDPERLIVLEYQPLRATVTKNSFAEADTFEVQVDFEDFPLDPRIIEGATCEVFMAAADSLDPDFWVKQSLEDMRTRYGLMAGVVDHIKTGIGPDGRETVLKGRDYTAYFLDVEAEAKPVSYMAEDGKTKLTFVEVIEKILDRDATRAITVRDRDKIPALYPADYKMRADEDLEIGTRKKKEGEVVWEVLQEIALEAGHVIYVDLDEIVIRKPRTVFVDDGMNEASWFHWTIGEDVKSFHPERKMGRQQGINVKVTSYLDDDKKVLTAIRPKNPLAAQKVEIPASKMADEEGKTSKKKPRVTFRPYIVRGIKLQSQVEAIADALYDLVQHHELEGRFETDQMFDSNDREVWRIGYGDPVSFDISESLASIVSLDQEEQIRRLIEVGYDDVDARNIALSIKSAGVPFYFHSVTHTFRAEEDGGYTMEAEIRSRRQVDISPEAS